MTACVRLCWATVCCCYNNRVLHFGAFLLFCSPTYHIHSCIITSNTFQFAATIVLVCLHTSTGTCMMVVVSLAMSVACISCSLLAMLWCCSLVKSAAICGSFLSQWHRHTVAVHVHSLGVCQICTNAEHTVLPLGISIDTTDACHWPMVGMLQGLLYSWSGTSSGHTSSTSCSTGGCCCCWWCIELLQPKHQSNQW